MAIVAHTPYSGSVDCGRTNDYLCDGHGLSVDRTNRYISNGHGGHTLCEGYNCPSDPVLATEYMNTLRLNYERQHPPGEGRTKGSVTHVQFYVSPTASDNVPPEERMEMMRELIERTPLRDYASIRVPHDNTEDKHGHISLCPYSVDGTHKLPLNNKLLHELRREMDRICVEHGYSIIENPELWGDKQYKEWFFKVKASGTVKVHPPKEQSMASFKEDRKRARAYSESKMAQAKRRGKKKVEKRPEDELLTRLDIRSREELTAHLKGIGGDIAALKQDIQRQGTIMERMADLMEHINRWERSRDPAAYAYLKAHHCGTPKEIADAKKRYARAASRKAKNEALLQDRSAEYRHVKEAEKAFRPEVPFFAAYEYGKTNLAEINDNVRTVRDEDGGFRVVQRTPTEKKVLADIRVKDSEVRGLIDTTHLHRIIAEQSTRRKQRKPYLTATREQELVAQIQSSFQCLQYTERHGIYSYEQIITLYAANKAKYDATIDNFTKAETAIGQLKEILLIPQKLADLEAKIDAGRHDVNYILDGYNADKKAVSEYRATMKRYKIDTQQGLSALERKVADFDAKQSRNRGYMAKVVTQMAELENCIRTFDRIDAERGGRNIQAIREFERTSGKQISERAKKAPSWER